VERAVLDEAVQFQLLVAALDLHLGELQRLLELVEMVDLISQLVQTEVLELLVDLLLGESAGVDLLGVGLGLFGTEVDLVDPDAAFGVVVFLG
jgi:hypothetical protein